MNNTQPQIWPAARTAGVIQDPKVGLMIMGRKRPGFDPEWGAAVRRAVQGYLEGLPFGLTVPSDNIADEAELQRAVEVCRTAGVTVMLLVQPTISDGRLAPMLARLWQRPLLLWATTEKPGVSSISANSLVGTHVMAATLRQLGHPLELVFGHPEDHEVCNRVEQSIRAVHAADSLQRRKLGLVGYHAPGFVDFHADPVFLQQQLGSQLYHLNTPELMDMVMAYTNQELEDECAAFLAWQLPVARSAQAAGFSADARQELLFQARYYRAFRDLFDLEGFDAMAFRCWPDLPTVLGHWPYAALARLVSEGFPIAMEGDVDGALCSRLAESAGMGPVYLSDWLEHTADSITIWHTGAAPLQLARPAGVPGGPELGVQFNNKKPTVIESTIRSGMKATLFRLWRCGGGYRITALEGETIDPARHIEATNGVFSTDRVDVRRWFEDMVQLGMPHHVCLVEGHVGDTLRRIARMIGAAWV
ncbi:L-fucose/L-arabinose isomerase family protein [Spirochaeta africana]|uniref:L-fucose isomerase family protein n=1 Tax=Spirochaeta africana (strain ATCC 700263 / DSM 8902 / Z-7692) TaxID=889378 RepID=H9UFE0_SPIAZ|nr:L-fucose/L-arabinose isomerase family protein [Spirochaeta africana]AFG36233.1 L-fucose isomerase family protein [Spirochaeta africana DSM 8902]